MLALCVIASLANATVWGSTKDVLADFDRKHKQKHAIAADLADVPVLITDSGEDLPEVLATLLGATWVKEGDTMLLKRSESQAAQVDDERNAWFRSAIERNLATPLIPDAMWELPDLLFKQLQTLQVPESTAPATLSLSSIAREMAKRILLEGDNPEAVNGGPFAWPPAPGFKQLSERAVKPIQTYLGIVADPQKRNAWKTQASEDAGVPTRVVAVGSGFRSGGQYRLYALDAAGKIVDQDFYSWQLHGFDREALARELPSVDSVQLTRPKVFDRIYMALTPFVRQIRFSKTEAEALRADVKAIDQIGLVPLLLNPIAEAIRVAGKTPKVALAFDGAWINSLLFNLHEPRRTLERALRLGYQRSGARAETVGGRLFLRPACWNRTILPIRKVTLAGLPDLTTVPAIASWSESNDWPSPHPQVGVAASTQPRWFQPQAARSWKMLDAATQSRLQSGTRVPWSQVPTETARRLIAASGVSSPASLDDLREGASTSRIDKEAGWLVLSSKAETRMFALANVNALNMQSIGLDAFAVNQAHLDMKRNDSAVDIETVEFEPVRVVTFSLDIVHKSTGARIHGWMLGRVFRSIGPPATLANQSEEFRAKLKEVGFKFRPPTSQRPSRLTVQ